MSDITGHILIGVDDSHADSREAMIAGFSFLRSRDHAVLFTVIPKNVASKDIAVALESAYSSYCFEFGFEVKFVTADLPDDKTVAETFLKEARIEKARMLVIGAGGHESGTLGSVAKELVANAYRHVLVVKRQVNRFQIGKPRVFVFAADGSEANQRALAALASMLHPTDVVRCVTLSHHNGEKDKHILTDCARIIATANPHLPPENSSYDFVARNQDSVGAQLCDFVGDIGAHCLAVASSRESIQVLGSVTMYCVSHSPVSVLVMKVVVNS